MNLKNKNILLVGLAKTGVSTIKLLNKLEANIIVNDIKDKEKLKDILEELKTKGYTTYKLRKDKVIGEAQIQKIRTGEIASKETLNTICKLLQCQPGDILEYIENIND